MTATQGALWMFVVGIGLTLLGRAVTGIDAAAGSMLYWIGIVVILTVPVVVAIRFALERGGW